MSFLKTLLMLSSLLRVGGTHLNFSINYAPVVEIKDSEDIVILSPYAEVRGNKSKAFAYLSLGEVNRASPFFHLVPSEIIIRENPRWNSYLVDVSSPYWQEVVKKELEYISDRGFNNFFLDTVDAVDVLGRQFPTREKEYKKSMADLVKMIKMDNPSRKIIVNRGFAVYDEINSCIDGVLIESLFFKEDKGKWVERSADDMKWLENWVMRLSRDRKIILGVDYSELSRKERVQFEKRARSLGVSWKTLKEGA